MDVEKREPKMDWLDAALRARNDAGPRAGLEERVLARLASEPIESSFQWWKVATAAAAVIVVAIALIVMHRAESKGELAAKSPESATSSQKVQQSSSPPATIASVKSAENQSVVRHGDAGFCVPAKKRGIRHSAQQHLPMLTTFPAPRPETAEERLIARLAARHGSFDIASITNDFRSTKELTIPKLNIEPLEGTPADDAPRK